MPEGPEVKTVARTLAHSLIGKRLGKFWHSPFQLRRAVDHASIAAFENGVVTDVSCYGKLLFIDVDQKPALLAQLGMTGQLTIVSSTNALALHTHVRWPLVGTDLELRYVDPRRFGLFAYCSVDDKTALLDRLGPDPFSMMKKDHAHLSEAMRRSTRAIKEILLDQAIVVGVGNIYASEALFRARINPLTPGVDLSKAACTRLITAIVDILRLAYDNCGTTFSSYVDGTGKKGDNLAFLKVFQKTSKPCQHCSSPILRIKQGGRSTFYCASCQPLSKKPRHPLL